MGLNVTVRFVLLLSVYVAYVIIGAMLFSLIERPKEQELRMDLNTAIEKFLVDHRHCLTGKTTALYRAECRICMDPLGGIYGQGGFRMTSGLNVASKLR